MRNFLVLVTILTFSASSFAGIESVLVKEQHGKCTVRIVHDSTPSSQIGTIVFRSFKIIDGLHHTCDLTKDQVIDSLARGIAKYLSHEDLKPVSSIFVGRISRFPWINSSWQSKGQSGKYERMSNRDFNALVSSKDISQPFETALNRNGLKFGGASCEKIQFYKNGAPMDALCWFGINGP